MKFFEQTLSSIPYLFIHLMMPIALLETSGAVSGRGSVSATYVTDKSATDFLFTDLTGILIPKTIRDGGGFYDISEKIIQK